MSTVKLKRSAIAGRVPAAGDLQLGEVAINTHDGKMYLKRDANGAVSIIEVGKPDSTSNVLYVSKTGNDAHDGATISTSFLTIEAALSAASSGTTIFVKSGDYVLDNSNGGIEIPSNVSLYGDNLRTTSISGVDVTNDLFYVNQACYLTNFTFRNMASGAAAISFPPGGMTTSGVYVSPYIENCTSLTQNGGTGMRIDGNLSSGLKSMVSDSFTQINGAPTSNHPNATTLLANNREWIQDETIAWINEQIGTNTAPFTSSFVYDEEKCYRDTGLIVDAIIKDLEESQYVSSNAHSIIAAKLYYAPNGVSRISGQQDETAAALQKTRDLIEDALLKTSPSDGTYQASSTQNTSGADAEAGSSAQSVSNVQIIIDVINNGLSSLPTEISGGGIGVHLLNGGYAQLVSIFTVSCHIGILAESGGQCSLTNSNCGFGNYGLRATGAGPSLYTGTTQSSSVANVDTSITISSPTQKPRYGDVMQFQGISTYYTVETVAELQNGNYKIGFRETLVDNISSSLSITFHQRSLIAASSITFEYVGTGVSLYDTPQAGAFPIQQHEVEQDTNNQGQVYFTSTDQRGDFRIGGDLSINRTDGIIEGETFDRSLFAIMTPYILALEGN